MPAILDSTKALFWLSLQGESLEEPQAWQSCYCWLPGHQGDVFQLDDQPLRAIHTERRGITLLWPALEPGFYLLKGRSKTQTHSWQIYVSARYLPQSEYLQLLQELRYQQALRATRQRSAHVPVIAQVELPQDYREELQLMQNCLQSQAEMGFFEALETWKRQAREELVLRTDWVKVGRIKRMSAANLRQALSSLSPHHSLLAQQPQVQWDRLHGLVGALVQRLRQRLRGLLNYVQQVGDTQAQIQIEAWQQRLEQLWHAHPLAELPPCWEMPDKLIFMLKTPSYRALYRLARLERQVLPSLEGGLLWRYQPFALLYQKWCALRLAQALDDWGQAQGWEHTEIRAPGVLLGLRKQAQHLTLYSEKYFGERTALRAVTRPQRPDLALHYSSSTPQGVQERWIIFEVKYRMDTERARKADLDKVHAYRDALRDASGRALVTLGVLLYPGPTQDYSPFIQAWESRPQGAAWPLEQLLSAFF